MSAFTELLGCARKQGIVIGIAVCISLLLVFLAYLESTRILPSKTAMTGLYAAIFLVWPYLSSTSGALAYRCRRRPGFAESAQIGFFSIVTMLVLAGVGLYAILEVNATVSERDMASILRTVMKFFKDTNYILLGDSNASESLLQGSTAKFLLGIFTSFVCFSCGSLFAQGISHLRTAAISGCIVGLSISGITLHCWIRLDLMMLDDVLILEPGYLGSILLVLGSSATLIFLWPLVLKPDRRPTLLLRTLVAAGLPTIVFLAVAYPRTIQLLPNSAVVYEAPFSTRDGKYIVASVFDSSRNSLAPRIWRISVSGGKIVQLAGRLAYNPVLSPDGKWIGYLSQRNIIGLAQDSVGLRLVRIDGTQDHLLASGLADSPYFGHNICDGLSFSPDSSRLALICDDSLIASELGQGRLVTIPLPRGPQWFLAGWDSAGLEVLVAPRIPPGPLLACNPDHRQIRVLADNKLGRRNFIFPPASGGIRSVLLGNSLLDLKRGDEQKVAESNFYLAATSADGSTLVYSASEGRNYRPSNGEIHWRDLSSGLDYTALSFEQGCLEGPFLVSPNGNRLVAWDCAEGGQSVVIDRRGAVKHFPSGWKAFAWISNDEIAFWKVESSIPLAIGNAANLTLKILR